MRTISMILVTVALLGAGAACGDGWESFWEVHEPYESGTLCIYSAHGEAQLAIEIDEFHRRYPDITLRCDDTSGLESAVLCEKKAQAIREGRDAEVVDCAGSEWEVVRLSTGQLLTRLQAEADHGKISADVVGGLAISHLLDFAGYLQPYRSRGVPRITAQIDDSERADIWKWFVDNDQIQTPRWFGINLFTLGLCVNTNKLAELEESWKNASRLDNPMLPETDLDYFWRERLPWQVQDGTTQLRSWRHLFDPLGLFDGRIAVPRPDASGTGFNFLMGVIAQYGDGNDNDPAWDVMDRVDGTVVVYTDRGSEPCSLAGDPASPVIVGLTYDGKAAGEAAIEHGVFDVVWPAPGEGYYDIEGVGIVKGTANLGTAQTFLDWASDAGMEQFQQTAAVTAIPATNFAPHGFPPSPLFLAMLKHNLDFTYISSNRVKWQTDWRARYCADAALDLDCVPATH